jgi:hypothetical protein
VLRHVWRVLGDKPSRVAASFVERSRSAGFLSALSMFEGLCAFTLAPVATFTVVLVAEPS